MNLGGSLGGRGEGTKRGFTGPSNYKTLHSLPGGGKGTGLRDKGRKKKGRNMVIWLNNMLPTISNWIRYSSFPVKVSQALLYAALCQTRELLPAVPQTWV